MGFNSAFKGLNTLLQSYQSNSPNYVFVYKAVYRNWLHLIQDTTSLHSKVFIFMLLSQGRKDKTWEPTDRVMFFLVPRIFFFLILSMKFAIVYCSSHSDIYFYCVIVHKYCLRYTESDGNKAITVYKTL